MLPLHSPVTLLLAPASAPCSCSCSCSCSCLWARTEVHSQFEVDLADCPFSALIWIYPTVLKANNWSEGTDCAWKKAYALTLPRWVMPQERKYFNSDSCIWYSLHAWQPFPTSWTNPPVVFPWDRFFLDLPGACVKCFLSWEKTGSVCKSHHHTLQVNSVI